MIRLFSMMINSEMTRFGPIPVAHEVVRLAVLLYRERVGTIEVRGPLARFKFEEEYLESAQRSVLGLRFEEQLTGSWTGQRRLPAWFSNVLPEGRLRQMLDEIASSSEDEPDSLGGELRLLERLGRDLPGAVEVLALDGDEFVPLEPFPSENESPSELTEVNALRFSIAGVGLKFSMLRTGEQFTSPAEGLGGDWIVKMPDRMFPELPLNEFTMMSLAGRVGIDVPDIDLIDRDRIAGLPDGAWSGETKAYAVRRFDRRGGDSVHIEDLAQVRGFYPSEKYRGSFETLAAMVYRGRDASSLTEAVRRLAFNAVVGNWDAHLKNWSLIYLDRKIPTLSPAYDVVSVAAYPGSGLTPDLGLRLEGTRDFSGLRLRAFQRLGEKL